MLSETNGKKIPITIRHKGKSQVKERHMVSNTANHTPELSFKDALILYTEKELKKLFSALDLRQYSGFRDKVIMLLLLDTGIRVMN